MTPNLIVTAENINAQVPCVSTPKRNKHLQMPHDLTPKPVPSDLSPRTIELSPEPCNLTPKPVAKTLDISHALPNPEHEMCSTPSNQTSMPADNDDSIISQQSTDTPVSKGKFVFTCERFILMV